MYCHCRQNPDDALRKAERQHQQEDSFETQVHLLKQKLRSGELTADRVEAAAEIGSKEAQVFVRPTGIVGIDWAVSILADYFPLRPIIEKATLHALSKQYSPEAMAYIQNTFANPKFHLWPHINTFNSRFMDSKAARFAEQTMLHIRGLLRANVTNFLIPGHMGIWDNAVSHSQAVRNVWFLSNSIPEEIERSQFAEFATDTLVAVRNTPDPEGRTKEHAWQLAYLISLLLGTEPPD